MFRKIAAFIIISCIVNLCAGIQSIFAQKGKDRQDNNSLLWKISGNGLEKPSYLFGTIHQICDDHYVWTDVMESALMHSEKVCLEMDLDDPGLQLKMADQMVLKDGTQLKDYFKEDEYHQLVDYFKAHDARRQYLMALPGLKPIAILSILIQASTVCSNSSMVSYEINLVRKAIAEGKEVLGLETPEEQFAALHSLHNDSVVSQINSIVNGTQADNGSQLLAQLTEAYSNQNLGVIQELMSEFERQQGGISALLDDRNLTWIPLMDEMMKKNSVFFGVGAAHLPGDAGVINLLREHGYSVEMVR